MKKSLFFTLLLSIIFIFSSCVPLGDIFNFEENYVEDSIDFYELPLEDQYEIVEIVATAYNKGGNNSLQQLQTYIDSDSYSYDDNVLDYFKYFTGKTDNPKSVRSFYEDSNRIPELTNYIKNITENEEDNSDTNFLIDLYDFDIPEHNYNNDDLEIYVNEDFLVERIKYFIMNYSFEFDTWFEEYYPTKTINDSLIEEYARYLVRLAKTYTRSEISLNRLISTTSELYPSNITLKNIPVELIISIMAQESHFFPGSYRGEVDSNERIQTISFGLTHFLLDADFTFLGGESGIIGDNNRESYNFNQVSKFYLGNNDLEENIFNDWHLLSTKGNVLYSNIFLEMIWSKFITPNF
ncbi:hypothetical protein [Geotoga petraea]|uniref:Uncharacterized protein n=1 Tax=Geotoga petraea TaxID=28234 RepID=A0A4Z0W0Q0_9BACT|nr:hypothetical protein [Geotoga petraea]TGG87957.1 hypothetical protein E4650_06340 [Geotoga petraea]